jgi:hypothetical protein
MRRHVVRSASLLLIILLLAVGTTSAPVSAGSMTGGNALLSFFDTPGLSVGTCAFGQALPLPGQTSGHYFVGRLIGAKAAPGNLNNHQFSFGNVLINGPYTTLPVLDRCTDVGTIT